MRIKFHIIFSLALFLTKFECSFADEISRKFYKTWISAVENENSDRIRELIGAKFETNLEKDKLLEKLVQKYKSIKFKEDENAIFTMDLKYFDGSEVKLKGENVGGKIEIRKIVGDAVKNDGFLKFERDFDKAIKGKNRKILEFLIIGPNGGQKALFINWLISQKSLKITRIRSDRRKYRIKSGPTFFIIFVEKVEQFYKITRIESEDDENSNEKQKENQQFTRRIKIMTALHSKNYTIFGELSSDLQKIIDKEGPGNIKFEKNRVVLEFSSGIYIAAEIENDKINKIRLGSYDFHETLEEFNKASGERNQSSLENILRSAKFLTKSAGKAEVLKYILENRLQLRIKKSKYQPESEISFDLSNEKFNLQLIFNFKEKRIVRGKLNFAKNSKSFAENAVNVLAGYLEGEKLKDDLSEVVGADFKMRNGNLTGGIDILINWLNSQNLETIATLQKNFTNEIHQVSLDNGAEKLILIIRNGKFTHAQIQQICLEENLQKFMRILKNGSSEELSSIFSTTFSLRSHQTKYPRFLSINIIDHLRKSQEIKIESRIYPGTAKIYMGKVKLYIYPKKLQIDSGFVPELRANEDVQDLRSYYDFFENILQTSKISKDFKMILDKEGTFINRARFLRGIQGPNRTLSMKNLGFSLYQVNDAIIYSDQLGASINFYFARKNEELVLERAEYDIDVFLGE